MEEPTPKQVVDEIRRCRMSYRDTLGEFLARYHRLYEEASDHGVMGVEGIFHLIPLLPSDWRAWAASLTPRFIDRAIFSENLYCDCRGFIAAIGHQYFSFLAPPLGPYEIPPSYASIRHLVVPEPPMTVVPFMYEPIEQAPLVPVPEPKPVIEPFPAPFAEHRADTSSYIAPFDAPVNDSTSQFFQFEAFPDVVPETPVVVVPSPPPEHFHHAHSDEDEHLVGHAADEEMTESEGTNDYDGDDGTNEDRVENEGEYDDEEEPYENGELEPHGDDENEEEHEDEEGPYGNGHLEPHGDDEEGPYENGYIEPHGNDEEDGELLENEGEPYENGVHQLHGDDEEEEDPSEYGSE